MGQVYSIAREARRRRIDRLLAEYDLEQQRAQRAGTLSGGERQRLALAAATLHGPELLFLDEPTSAVDPESRRRFWASLFRLVDEGTTILVSTHYMDEAERCHRLAILDRGRVAIEGVPSELTARIDAGVVEVATSEVRRAREALVGVDGVQSVSQLGARLRVLVRRDLQRPAERLGQELTRCGIAADLRPVAANLEDVFVAATRPAGGGGSGWRRSGGPWRSCARRCVSCGATG
jgi:ABC-2 type transport system ATP-binding protein